MAPVERPVDVLEIVLRADRIANLHRATRSKNASISSSGTSSPQFRQSLVDPSEFVGRRAVRGRHGLTSVDLDHGARAFLLSRARPIFGTSHDGFEALDHMKKHSTLRRRELPLAEPRDQYFGKRLISPGEARGRVRQDEGCA